MTKFTYDDIVKIISTAPVKDKHDAKAWVVGIFNTQLGGYFDKFPEGIVYMIEFEDGSTANIHETNLVLYDNNL